MKISAIEDPDWADLVVFPLEHTMYENHAFTSELPNVIPHRTAFWRADMTGHFIIRDFPHDLRSIDDATGVIQQQAIQVEADYARPSPLAHCSENRSRDISMGTTFDGLSGTPACWLGETVPREK